MHRPIDDGVSTIRFIIGFKESCILIGHHLVRKKPVFEPWSVNFRIRIGFVSRVN